MQRMVREITDHREDLKQAAMEEGMQAIDAEARADAQLGEPVVLAEHLMASLRQSSWWGRHPIVSFFLLPLLGTPVLWALLWIAGAEFTFLVGEAGMRAAADKPQMFGWIVLAVHGTNCIAIGLIAILFCWLARRAALGFKWTLMACAMISVHALFCWIKIVPHNFSVGYGLPFYHWIIPKVPLLNWVNAAMSLLIATAAYIWQRQNENRARKNITA
jgi:hypothetical protein